MVQAPARVSRLALTKRGDSGAQGAGLRRVTWSWVNRLTVTPELPELMEYLNAL